jgi:hypothetical protein
MRWRVVSARAAKDEEACNMGMGHYFRIYLIKSIRK